jgi:hypothetical protein
VTRPLSAQQKIGYGVGLFGILWVFLTLVTEAAFHVRHVELPPHWVYASMTAGAVVGWWGFFWANSKRAKEGGTWVMDAADPFHAHRRRDDPPLPPDLPHPPEP